MKPFSFIVVGTHLIAAAKGAEFWISLENGFFRDSVKFTPNYPQCTAELHNAKQWEFSNDVSGDKYGVRISGDYLLDPNALEWNTGEDYLGHHTVYKDRDYKIYNTLDQVRGQCVVDNSHVAGCYYGKLDFETDYSIFKCTSDFIKLPK